MGSGLSKQSTAEIWKHFPNGETHEQSDIRWDVNMPTVQTHFLKHFISISRDQLKVCYVCYVIHIHIGLGYIEIPMIRPQ